MEERRVKNTLWKRGELDYLLVPVQREMKKAFYDSEEKLFIFLCSRRFGKSFISCGIALEHAIKHPGARIMYFTSAFEYTKKVVQPTMSKLLTDCSRSLLPTYKTQDRLYKFPNGSQIQLYGSDKNPDGPRGQEADLVVLDEMAFMSQLDYIIKSVIRPMLLTTNGRIIGVTTPPKSTDHPFIKYLEEAQSKEAFIKKTIYDADPKVITPKQIEGEKANVGGEDTTEWKTEYLCQIIDNDDLQVIPEWTEDKQASLVQPIVCPNHADRYTGMDLGYMDATGMLFGHWDMPNARLVIEDELLVSRENTEQIAEGIKAKETARWDGRKIFKRIADNNNPQMLHDLATLHGVRFQAVRKTQKEQMVNQLRLMIAHDQLYIHPRCKQLIAQLKYCRWKNSTRAEFSRSDSYSHFDLVDALIYLVISLNRNNSQIDPGEGFVKAEAFIPSHLYENKSTRNLEKIIPTKFRKKPTKIKRRR